MNKLLAPSLALLLFMSSAHAANDCVAGPRTTTVINAKDSGAKGDGTADDTAAIQRAINQAAHTGGTVLIPDGTYLINALVSVQLKSDMTLRLSDGAVLKAMPNAEQGYSIVKIDNVSNANLFGGTLLGERDEHQGTGGEWGMGVYVNAASNISIVRTTAKNNWGNGFYVRGASRNIQVCSVMADNNRRQGMSIIAVDGMLVKDSIFRNTNGTAPQAGLDIEPNENDTVSNVRILNSHFVDNRGIGVQIYVAPRSVRSIRDVVVDGNTVTGNRLGGIWVENTNDNRIVNNTVQANRRFGIAFAKGTRGNQAANNMLIGGDAVIDLGDNTLVGNRQR